MQMNILPDSISRTEAKKLLFALGIKGAILSTYYSFKHSERPDSLILSKYVISEISGEAEFNLKSRLIIGLITTWASHPRLAKGKFAVESGATVRTTASGPARIGPYSVVHVHGDFEIGDAYINSGAKILCEEKITIGDNCAIAWGVTIVDTDRHKIDTGEGSTNMTAPVKIGDNVWIGYNSSINKGVTIGEGAVIGSNSVVVNDIPPRSLAVGVPAQPIKFDVTWD